MNNITTKESRLKNFPISFFSIMLGLLGFTIANQKAVEILKLPYDFSTEFFWLSAVIYSVLIITFLIKLAKYPTEISKEYNHPIKMNFFPTITISLLMFSIVLLNINMIAAKYIWILGTVGQTIFTFSLLSKWIHQDVFKIDHFIPAWFIPAVGNILVPIAGIQFFSKEISWFYFSVGLMLWIVLLTIFFYRAFFHAGIVDKLLPTLFLLIAPQAVGFIAYVKLTGSIDPFAKILYNFALFTVILLFSQIRIFVKLKFYLSWWAYSFPVSAFAISSMLMFHKSHYVIYKYISFFIFGVLNLLMLTLIYQTILHMLKREICIEE